MRQDWTPRRPDDAPAGGDDDDATLPLQIMNMMDQGILVWSAEGVCALHNTRIFRVLEITGTDPAVGTTKEEFGARATARGEIAVADMEASDHLIRAR